jgi:hypothetical protein
LGTHRIKEGFGITRMRALIDQLERLGAKELKFDIDSKPTEGTNVELSLVIPENTITKPLFAFQDMESSYETYKKN